MCIFYECVLSLKSEEPQSKLQYVYFLCVLSEYVHVVDD